MKKIKLYIFFSVLTVLTMVHYVTAQVPVVQPKLGGTGTSTTPTTDQIFYGRSSGLYEFRTISGSAVSTSTAGRIIITDIIG